MLELPGRPLLDKATLIGGCARLPVAIDHAQLLTETATLPEEDWAGSRGTRGVHRAAQALFLKGQPPTKGNLPIEDRPALSKLPYVRKLIDDVLGGGAQRCLLARLPPGAVIPPHEDTAPYFSQTVRLHMPLHTHERVWMVCAGMTYQMRPGEVWALNNNTVHAVWNEHPTASRTHLICDFLPSARLLALLAMSDRNLGCVRPEVDAYVASQLPSAAVGAE